VQLMKRDLSVIAKFIVCRPYLCVSVCAFLFVLCLQFNDNNSFNRNYHAPATACDVLYRPLVFVTLLTLYRHRRPQTNRPLYSDMVIGTLAVDGWAVTFGTARRSLREAS